MTSALLLTCVAALTQGESVTEARGSVLVLDEGRLYRERSGRRTELGCTDERGPGRVLDIALDPAGLAFVAAERGLFVLGPYVDVLDPLERLDGAPPGHPTSVHVDALRRVWIATENAAGALEPSFGWGRTLARDDLPGGGPYRISAHAGSLALSGTAGVVAYSPDVGPAPRITLVLLDGVEVDEGARLERASGDVLALSVTGDARGGATFRYRFDRHHVWHVLPSEHELTLPDPGAHVLEIVAVDQDLRRSPPRSVRLAIAYPAYYGARFVTLSIAGAAALGLVLVLVTGRTRGRARVVRALVSTCLAVALALQLVAGSLPHARGWPFVGFGMYTRSFAASELVYEEQLVLLRPDGSELFVRPESPGVAVDEFWQVGRPLIDGGPPAMRAFLADWRRRFPATGVCGLQLQARRARLTRAGPVQVAPLVLAHYREPSGG
jgi:hypothetical protein